VNVIVDDLSDSISINGIGSVKVFDIEGRTVGANSMRMEIAPKGRLEEPLLLFINLPKEDITEFFFNRTVLTYKLVAEFRSQDRIVSRIEKAVLIDLGTPIKELKIGRPTKQLYNSTHMRFIFPLNLTNDSGLIEVKGSLEATTLDGKEDRIGSSYSTVVDIMPKSFLNYQLTFYIGDDIMVQEISKLLLTFHTGYGTIQKIIPVSP